MRKSVLKKLRDGWTDPETGHLSVSDVEAELICEILEMEEDREEAQKSGAVDEPHEFEFDDPFAG